MSEFTEGHEPRFAPLDRLERFCREVFTAIGADQASADAASKAMRHASELGVDSHGVRLLAHYVTGMEGGRINPRPDMRFVREGGAVATLDADDAHGAVATYAAMDRAIDLARAQGIGAVGVTKSSHFGAAGAYAAAAAEAGFVGMAFCNSDSFVRLHDGAARFHGTNPIAFAAPVGEGRPWLLDMATSAIPFNRVKLLRGLRKELPREAASDEGGQDTTDADLAAMLAPLGGAFGFKGAGLAGMVEIFSAVLTGMRLSHEIAPMAGPDFSTPRGLGAFVAAIDPGAFVERVVFEDGMRRYVETLRSSPTRRDAEVMAPGDREWRVAEKRLREGAPVDPVAAAEFDELARRLGLTSPFAAEDPAD